MNRWASVIGDKEIQVDGLRIDWITSADWKWSFTPTPTFLDHKDLDRATAIGEREVSRKKDIIGYTIKPHTFTMIV